MKSSSPKAVIRILIVMASFFMICPQIIYATWGADAGWDSSTKQGVKGNWEITWYTIIPEVTVEQSAQIDTAIENIWKTGWQVMDQYDATAEAWKNRPEMQLASGIMNRDTIMKYLEFIVKFLSQLWMAVWVIFIMFAWYKYMVSIFNWQKTWAGTIKNAIIWVIIVIFSYAILKTLTSLAWI